MAAIRSCFAAFFWLLTLLGSGSAFSEQDEVMDQTRLANLIQTAMALNLGNSPEWHALLHYRPRQFFGPRVSQADDPRFFLSPNGKHSPEDELVASLKAFLKPGRSETHAICRFPARLHWLKDQLDLTDNDFPTPPCTEFRTWKESLDTRYVTLVFASSYLNSPSSMFGHTFLRLDPPGTRPENLLLANTISYSANAVNHDNELMFAYRGIFGGYPGITEVVPYYQKIKLYTDMEDRDIWEYRLNLSTDEVQQLLRHAWEIQDINFDYFFFDENCAYRILALLDVARPGLNLTADFPVRAIPSDTVRAIVAKGLVSLVHYRPSASTKLKFKIRDLSQPEQAIVKQIVDTGEASANLLKGLNETQAVHVIDASYEYTRYLAGSERLDAKAAAKLSYQLLAMRSQYSPVAEVLPPEPAIRDDQGHPTFRYQLTTGIQADKSFWEIGFRPAYHDLMDSPSGYREGSQLEFLNTRFRYLPDTNQFDLQHVTIINIYSLSPVDSFFQPLSWNINWGITRSRERGTSGNWVPYLEGGAGYTLKAGGLWYSLLNGRLELDKQSENNFLLGPQLSLGYLTHLEHGTFHLNAAHNEYRLGEQRTETLISAAYRHYITDTIALDARFQWDKKADLEQTTWQTSVYYYH